MTGRVRYVGLRVSHVRLLFSLSKNSPLDGCPFPGSWSPSIIIIPNNSKILTLNSRPSFTINHQPSSLSLSLSFRVFDMLL